VADGSMFVSGKSTENQIQELLAEVEAAFADVAREDGITLHQAVALRSMTVVKLFVFFHVRRVDRSCCLENYKRSTNSHESNTNQFTTDSS